jgi:hypothetical protein
VGVGRECGSGLVTAHRVVRGSMTGATVGTSSEGLGRSVDVSMSLSEDPGMGSRAFPPLGAEKRIRRA